MRPSRGLGGDDVIRVTVIPDTGRLKVTLNGVKMDRSPDRPYRDQPGRRKEHRLVDKAVAIDAVLYGGSSGDFPSKRQRE
jgi:hypothetical protein